MKRFQPVGCDLRFRAYDVIYTGSFIALRAYAQNLGGTAYVYEREDMERQNARGKCAIVTLPEQIRIGPGHRITREGCTCEILYALWITPP